MFRWSPQSSGGRNLSARRPLCFRAQPWRGRAGAEWEMGEHGEHQEGTSRSKFTLPLLRWGSCRHVADTTRHVVLPSGDHVVLMLSPMSICRLFWLVWLVSMMPSQSFSILLVPFPILLVPFLPTLFVLFVRSELSCYSQKRSKVQSFRAIPTSMSCVFSSLQWDHTCFCIVSTHCSGEVHGGLDLCRGHNGHNCANDCHDYHCQTTWWLYHDISSLSNVI